jgi:hypothetical protein
MRRSDPNGGLPKRVVQYPAARYSYCVSEDWIAELAAQERERRKTLKIARGAAVEFGKVLAKQIFSDLHAYFKEFPQEHPNITQEPEPGVSVITRTRDEDTVYEGVPVQVRFNIDVCEMKIECSFPDQPALDRQFKMALTPEGALSLADVSIAGLSRYLLTPVLFDKLIPNDPPSPSEAY